MGGQGTSEGEERVMHVVKKAGESVDAPEQSIFLKDDYAARFAAFRFDADVIVDRARVLNGDDRPLTFAAMEAFLDVLIEAELLDYESMDLREGRLIRQQIGDVIGRAMGRVKRDDVDVSSINVQDFVNDYVFDPLDSGVELIRMTILSVFENCLARKSGAAKRVSDLRALAKGRLHDALAETADRDALTGLYNRGSWDESMAKLSDSTEDASQGLAIAFLDVDHFKQFNDTHGHQTGDTVLNGVAAQLANCKADFVARYGGEEFCAWKFVSDDREAYAFGEAIRLAIQNGVKVSSGGNELSVTASVGIFATTLGDFQKLGAEASVKTADDAVYAAKEAGRNKTHMFVLT